MNTENMKKEDIMAKVKSKPLEIIIGKSYKNFKGYERVVLNIFQHENTTKVTYNVFTGNPSTCNIDSFRQWIKKQYC